jgi:hypothetical protein
MVLENVLFWNVRRLHSVTHCDAVRELVTAERLSLASLQETKLDVILDFDVIQILGPGFDYAYLPAVHTQGGIPLAQRISAWVMSNPSTKSHSLSARVQLPSSGGRGADWWLTVFYVPSQEGDKPSFLPELREL